MVFYSRLIFPALLALLAFCFTAEAGVITGVDVYVSCLSNAGMGPGSTLSIKVTSNKFPYVIF